MKNVIFLLSFLMMSTVWADAKSKIVEAAGPLFDKVPSGQVVGVMPLQNTLKDDAEAGKSIAEILVNLGNAKGVTIVERAQLAKVMEEQSLIASGAVSEDNAAEIGELLSAQYLMTGRISELMGERLVALKLIKTESGEVMASANVSLGADAFKTMQKELLGEATQVSAVMFRSALFPGWGQMYAGKTGRGAAWLGGFLVSVGAGVWGTMEANKAFEDYEFYSDNSQSPQWRVRYCQEFACSPEDVLNTIQGDPVSEALAEDFTQWKDDQEVNTWDNYESKLGTSTIIWGVTAGIWALNLIDAYVVGSERKERLDLYFSAVPTRDSQGEFGTNVMVGFNF